MQNIDCTKISGKDIVERVLASPDFFYSVVRTYEAKLKAYISRLTNVSNEEVEDILQEVFIKVYQNINSYDSEFKFSTWLYRITRNETISHWRKHKKRFDDIRLNVSEDFIFNLRGDTDLPREMDNRFVEESIQDAINKLPFKYKEVVILRYMEDKDYQEISDILKKPVNTVGTLLNRAKNQLKTILE